MPRRGRATERNFPKFPDGLRSHIASCSLEGPRWSRDNLARGADGWLFSAVLVLASSVSGHVFWRDFAQQAQTPCVCTTPVSRRCHHGNGEGREALVRSSAASKHRRALLPASAQWGLNAARSPVSARFGCGAAHMDRERRSPQLQSRSGCPINGPGSGAKAPMGSGACPDAVR
jgi:hypothetical protein